MLWVLAYHFTCFWGVRVGFSLGFVDEGSTVEGSGLSIRMSYILDTKAPPSVTVKSGGGCRDWSHKTLNGLRGVGFRVWGFRV